MREGPLREGAGECSRIPDATPGQGAGWRTPRGKLVDLGPSSPSPQAFVRSFSVAVDTEYRSKGVIVQVPDSGGKELERDRSGNSRGGWALREEELGFSGGS